LNEGKGVLGYLKNVKKLKLYLKNNTFDIIHAHFGLSGIVACLAKTKQKVIISFMGDDLLGIRNIKGNLLFKSYIIIFLNKIFAKFCAAYSIVKSQRMVIKLFSDDRISVIPNGVDFDMFYPMEKEKVRLEYNIPISKKIILFAANPSRPEKNFLLAQKAYENINITDKELLIVYNVKQSELLKYYNLADVVILTSFHEGSPNVIKEAMACNVPIVSTDVGDVKEIISKTEGCYITYFDPIDVAKKLQKAIFYNKSTNGRRNIKHLESSQIAKKIINIYEQVLN
jgi:glycosyltransferase involved in cell wall biosynthesis